LGAGLFSVELLVENLFKLDHFDGVVWVVRERLRVLLWSTVRINFDLLNSTRIAVAPSSRRCKISGRKASSSACLDARDRGRRFEASCNSTSATTTTCCISMFFRKNYAIVQSSDIRMPLPQWFIRQFCVWKQQSRRT
jgi:hypothetical protein